MPKLQIDDVGTFDVATGRRLVLAIEDCGVDIGHRCGGKARCTTCRVRFLDGEPATMTRAEFDKLEDRGLRGDFRLSCQIVVQDDLHVAVGMRVSEMGWTDPGPPPAETVEPDPAAVPVEVLETTDP